MSSNFGRIDRDIVGGSICIGSTPIITKNKICIPKVQTSQIEFKQPVGPTQTCQAITIPFNNDQPITKTHLVKVSTSDDFLINEVNAGDNLNVGVIGVATSSSYNYNDIVNVCIAGIFTVEIEGNVTVTRGDRLVKSLVENGVATPTVDNVGVFGVALQSATPSYPVFYWTGNSDFDAEEITFDPLSDISSICFGGNAEAHSHNNPLTIYVSLWNGSEWIVVGDQVIKSGQDILMSTLYFTFETIPSVTKLRLSSNPQQNFTFHNINDLAIKFNCKRIKGCFVKSDSYSF